MVSIKRRAVALTSVAVAVAVTGCGAGAKSGGTSARTGGSHVATVPGSVIARAANVSSSAKGGAFTMSITEAVPGSGSIDINGSGTFSMPTHSGMTEMTMQADGQHLQFQEIYLGQRFYMKIPASLAAKLPGGKPWWEVDLSKVNGSSYLSQLSTLESSSSQSSPTMYLEYLKAGSTSLQNLGPATVDGVSATHYRAALNLEKAAANYPSSNRAAVQRMLQKMPGKIVNEADIPVNAWIDGASRLCKVTMTMTVQPKGLSHPITESIDMNMRTYGPQATPTPPPADQTVDLLALLKSEGKSTPLLGG